MADTLYIYGKHPVRDILARFPHTLKNIWIKESLKEKSVDEIVELAKKGKIPVSFATEKDLDAKVGDVNHQGVIALSKPYDYGSFDELVSNLAKAEKGTVVILDHIEDVHNFGAIIRSCAAFGVMAVCVSEYHQAPVTSAVFKTSAGSKGKRIGLICADGLHRHAERTQHVLPLLALNHRLVERKFFSREWHEWVRKAHISLLSRLALAVSTSRRKSACTRPL
jgi:23S rRNA (guanosine2251-2'-O)-methyltransferase